MYSPNIRFDRRILCPLLHQPISVPLTLDVLNALIPARLSEGTVLPETWQRLLSQRVLGRSLVALIEQKSTTELFVPLILALLY